MRSSLKELLWVSLSDLTSKRDVSAAAVAGRESSALCTKIKGGLLPRAVWNISMQLFCISCSILHFTTQFSLFLFLFLSFSFFFLFHSKQWRFSTAHWGHPNWKSLKQRFQLEWGPSVSGRKDCHSFLSL